MYKLYINCEIHENYTPQKFPAIRYAPVNGMPHHPQYGEYGAFAEGKVGVMRIAYLYNTN